jgi:hypothetical protein
MSVKSGVECKWCGGACYVHQRRRLARGDRAVVWRCVDCMRTTTVGPGRRWRWPSAVRRLCVGRRRDGYTLDEISMQTGVPRSTIADWCP